MKTIRNFARSSMTKKERLTSKILFPTKTTECWLWNGATHSHGYGQITINLKRYYAHRLSYEIFVGDIKKNLQIDHLCRNKRCVNPLHLEPVTSQENIRRGVSKTGINFRKTHCKYGHEFTKDNTNIFSGNRQCVVCTNRRAREYYNRKKSLVE